VLELFTIGVLVAMALVVGSFAVYAAYRLFKSRA
jgi:hypothetical protein